MRRTWTAAAALAVAVLGFAPAHAEDPPAPEDPPTFEHIVTFDDYHCGGKDGYIIVTVTIDPDYPEDATVDVTLNRSETPFHTATQPPGETLGYSLGMDDGPNLIEVSVDQQKIAETNIDVDCDDMELPPHIDIEESSGHDEVAPPIPSVGA